MAEYNELVKHTLWSELSVIAGYSPSEWRRDCFGNAVRYSDYGDRDSEYGWEIDHIRPQVLGGGDSLSNLRAIHWKANASMGGTLSGAISR